MFSCRYCNSTFHSFRNIVEHCIDIHKREELIININLDASRGSGFWKLNIKWLEDETYRNNIESIIQTT